MLSSAEADLARRDPEVPGLATVLDADALVAALRRAAPQADLRGAQITYASYKPRHACRVACRLNVGGVETDLGVRACRREDMARWLAGDGGLANVPGPLGPGRIVLEDRAVLLTVFPDDL